MNVTPLEKSANAARCELPASAVVRKVEECLSNFYLKAGNPASLELDASDCAYMEVTSLMILIALITQRARQGLSTVMRLPKSRDVRDILRLWEFPSALRHASNVPFSEIVHPDDLQFFGESELEASSLSSASKYIRLIKDPFDGAVERLLSDRFFAFTTFKVNTEKSRTRLVLQEAERWDMRLIRSVLTKRLQGPPEYFASRIVFESMMNAARHPNASLIQTASRFVSLEKDRKYAPHHFTLLYWDDGVSMIDTLSAAINEKKPIRSMELPELYADYAVKWTDDSGKVEKTETSSSSTPTLESTEEELLLATTFPGVTRDAEGKEHVTHPQLADQSAVETLPGMGLHVLINAAVDIFGGEVAFRTKRLFMNIKRADLSDSPAKYAAKLHRFDPTMPPFLGNMVAIRLPVGVDR